MPPSVASGPSASKSPDIARSNSSSQSDQGGSWPSAVSASGASRPGCDRGRQARRDRRLLDAWRSTGSDRCGWNVRGLRRGHRRTRTWRQHGGSSGGPRHPLANCRRARLGPPGRPYGCGRASTVWLGRTGVAGEATGIRSVGSSLRGRRPCAPGRRHDGPGRWSRGRAPLPMMTSPRPVSDANSFVAATTLAPAADRRSERPCRAGRRREPLDEHLVGGCRLGGQRHGVDDHRHGSVRPEPRRPGAPRLRSPAPESPPALRTSVSQAPPGPAPGDEDRVGVRVASGPCPR